MNRPDIPPHFEAEVWDELHPGLRVLVEESIRPPWLDTPPRLVPPPSLSDDLRTAFTWLAVPWKRHPALDSLRGWAPFIRAVFLGCIIGAAALTVLIVTAA